MFLQFVVHAHAKSLPTTAAKANPKHRPGRAQRSGVLSGAKRLIPVPTHPPTFENCADHLCCRLKALTLFSVVATKNTDYPDFRRFFRANSTAGNFGSCALH